MTEQCAHQTMWFKPIDAAEYARVSDSIIRAAIKAGDLASYTFGKGSEIRLRAEDVDEWLMARPYEPVKRPTRTTS